MYEIFQNWRLFSGVGPILQYSHVRYINSNTQQTLPNVVKVIFHNLRNCSYLENFCSQREQNLSNSFL